MPESAIGGPLALVRSGDRLRLSVSKRSIDLLVSAAELKQRADAWVKPEMKDERGYRKLFLDSVTQADEGCDFRFLRTGKIKETVPKPRAQQVSR
jgi:dihydroxy-acid dehydratase